MAKFQLELKTKVKGMFLENPERASEIFVDEIKKFLEEASSLTLRKVVQGTPVFQTGLSGSVFREVRGSGFDLHARVATPVIYANAQETGKFPSFPNAAGIEDWVRLKLGITNPRQLSQVTFLIARAIAKRKGFTKSHWMFKNAFLFLRSRAQGMLDKAADRIVRRWE